jgi:hypothetical protein
MKCPVCNGRGWLPKFGGTRVVWKQGLVKGVAFPITGWVKLTCSGCHGRSRL